MHPLEVILQLQMGSDQAVVLSLPSIISAITSAHFEASPHLTKWTSRLMSLIHSKHTGARWAGLCLALQTSVLNKELMMESAHSWVGVSLPLLARNEAPPTWKACIRLLDYIFGSTVGIPEFQRQVVTPNVPKFSASLVNLAEKNDDPGLRHTAMLALTHLIPLYPTLHRTLHNSLSSLTLKLLSGSSTSPTPASIIEDACNLHAVLHFTGGKVGAAHLWRKSMDLAIANAWFSFGAMRTTYAPVPQTPGIQPSINGTPSDPVIAIPLSLDRLKCAIRLIGALLTTVTLRPVSVPVEELVKLSLSLIRCAYDETREGYIDVVRNILEASVRQDIQQLGCELLVLLGKSVRHYLSPYLSRVVSLIIHQLEQPLPISQHIPFLRVLPSLLENTHIFHAPILSTRLVKALLPFLTVLLSSKTEVQQQLQENPAGVGKKGKKRARTYDGDEVFQAGHNVVCPTPEGGEAVLAALDALDCLLANPCVDGPVHALATCLLTMLALELPRYPPAMLSPNLTLHGQIHARVLGLCNKYVLAGASGWINSAVGLVVNAVGEAKDGSETVMHTAKEAQRTLDILLHPRLPPLLRSHPPVEAIALFRSENEKVDRETRSSLGLSVLGDVGTTSENVRSTAETTTVQHTAETTEPAVRTVTSQSIPSTEHAKEMAAATVSISTVTAPEVASTSTVMVPEAASTPLITTQSPDIYAMAKDSEALKITSSTSVPKRTQQDMVASTSIHVFKTTQYESSEDDEEMPEIDMGSDTD